MAHRHLEGRLTALETKHGQGGMTLAAALRLIRDLRTRRATFATYEEWRAYRDEQFAAAKLDAAVSHALREIMERRAGEDSTTAEKREARERADWRAHRAHQLLRERHATKRNRPSPPPTPFIR